MSTPEDEKAQKPTKTKKKIEVALDDLEEIYNTTLEKWRELLEERENGSECAEVLHETGATLPKRLPTMNDLPGGKDWDIVNTGAIAGNSSDQQSSDHMISTIAELGAAQAELEALKSTIEKTKMKKESMTFRKAQLQQQLDEMKQRRKDSRKQIVEAQATMQMIRPILETAERSLAASQEKMKRLSLEAVEIREKGNVIQVRNNYKDRLQQELMKLDSSIQHLEETLAKTAEITKRIKEKEIKAMEDMKAVGEKGLTNRKAYWTSVDFKYDTMWSRVDETLGFCDRLMEVTQLEVKAHKNEAESVVKPLMEHSERASVHTLTPDIMSSSNVNQVSSSPLPNSNSQKESAPPTTSQNDVLVTGQGSSIRPLPTSSIIQDEPTGPFIKKNLATSSFSWEDPISKSAAPIVSGHSDPVAANSGQSDPAPEDKSQRDPVTAVSSLRDASLTTCSFSANFKSIVPSPSPTLDFSGPLFTSRDTQCSSETVGDVHTHSRRNSFHNEGKIGNLEIAFDSDMNEEMTLPDEVVSTLPLFQNGQLMTLTVPDTFTSRDIQCSSETVGDEHTHNRRNSFHNEGEIGNLEIAFDSDMNEEMTLPDEVVISLPSFQNDVELDEAVFITKEMVMLPIVPDGLPVTLAVVHDTQSAIMTHEEQPGTTNVTYVALGQPLTNCVPSVVSEHTNSALLSVENEGPDNSKVPSVEMEQPVSNEVPSITIEQLAYCEAPSAEMECSAYNNVPSFETELPVNSEVLLAEKELSVSSMVSNVMEQSACSEIPYVEKEHLASSKLPYVEIEQLANSKVPSVEKEQPANSKVPSVEMEQSASNENTHTKAALAGTQGEVEIAPVPSLEMEQTPSIMSVSARVMELPKSIASVYGREELAANTVSPEVKEEQAITSAQTKQPAINTVPLEVKECPVILNKSFGQMEHTAIKTLPAKIVEQQSQHTQQPPQLYELSSQEEKYTINQVKSHPQGEKVANSAEKSIMDIKMKGTEPFSLQSGFDNVTQSSLVPTPSHDLHYASNIRSEEENTELAQGSLVTTTGTQGVAFALTNENTENIKKSLKEPDKPDNLASQMTTDDHSGMTVDSPVTPISIITNWSKASISVTQTSEECSDDQDQIVPHGSQQLVPSDTMLTADRTAIERKSDQPYVKFHPTDVLKPHSWSALFTPKLSKQSHCKQKSRLGKSHHEPSRFSSCSVDQGDLSTIEEMELENNDKVSSDVMMKTNGQKPSQDVHETRKSGLHEENLTEETSSTSIMVDLKPEGDGEFYAKVEDQREKLSDSNSKDIGHLNTRSSPTGHTYRIRHKGKQEPVRKSPRNLSKIKQLISKSV